MIRVLQNKSLALWPRLRWTSGRCCGRVRSVAQSGASDRRRDAGAEAGPGTPWAQTAENDQQHTAAVEARPPCSCVNLTSYGTPSTGILTGLHSLGVCLHAPVQLSSLRGDCDSGPPPHRAHPPSTFSSIPTLISPRLPFDTDCQRPHIRCKAPSSPLTE